LNSEAILEATGLWETARTAKLLGAPCLPDATGDSQFKAVKTLLQDRKIYHRVIGIVFGTRASNTGMLKGAASLMEKDLKTAKFWIACRHHMYEVHIKHAADLVLENGTRHLSPCFVSLRKFSLNLITTQTTIAF